MRRAPRWLGIGFGLFVFLGLSALVGRGLTGSGSERARVLRVVEAQARGDAQAVLADLPACARAPACVRLTRDRVAAMRRAGPVELLHYRPSVQVALTRRTGTGRVAWRAGDGRPVVQCVRVIREGPLGGAGLELLSISGPIPGEAGCG